MKRILSGVAMFVVLLLAVLAASADSAQDKYTVKVPGGLAFSEFKGYESWQLVSISQDGGKMAVILGNPTMIEAYQAGIPGNGKPFPDGAKMAKIHWTPKKMETFPAADGAGHAARRRLHGEGQQAVRGQRRLGIRRVRVRRRDRHVQARPRPPTRRRKRTTRSAASRATRW